VKIIKPRVEILAFTPDAELLIERCGRVCHKSEDKMTPESTGAFIRRIISMGHLSVLEHASATVLYVADRGWSHEQVRHRLASPSQESTRYCKYGTVEVCPVDDELTDAQKERRMELYLHSERVYLAELEEKVKPQIARDCLLTCQKTEMAFTANFREWRLIIEQRGAPNAHPRIQFLTHQLFSEFSQRWPNAFWWPS
jgi:thymidylate synthase (FAD)